MNKNKFQNISVKIDGKTINAPVGTTVLQAAQKAGIYIPTLCYLEHVIPFGGCRLCMVEIKNMRAYPTACTTPLQVVISVQITETVNCRSWWNILN
jgi:NADH dehydrogenase/NADH:ubiquinone oxidoreductase subunit G